MKLSDIDEKTVEGRLLIVTLGRLSVQPEYSHREPDDLLEEMMSVALVVYGDQESEVRSDSSH